MNTDAKLRTIFCPQVCQIRNVIIFTTAYPNVHLNLSFKIDFSVLQLLLKKQMNF